RKGVEITKSTGAKQTVAASTTEEVCATLGLNSRMFSPMEKAKFTRLGGDAREQFFWVTTAGIGVAKEGEYSGPTANIVTREKDNGV
ncbi:hypothetical protein HAX54_007952, partial [Datura stramonium]|nr:hypothetical protein [Datura stramonium]